MIAYVLAHGDALRFHEGNFPMMSIGSKIVVCCATQINPSICSDGAASVPGTPVRRENVLTTLVDVVEESQSPRYTDAP